MLDTGLATTTKKTGFRCGAARFVASGLAAHDRHAYYASETHTVHVEVYGSGGTVRSEVDQSDVTSNSQTVT
jgi:hypothetical protein